MTSLRSGSPRPADLATGCERSSSADEGDGALLARSFVGDDELAAVGRAKLLVRVQELDAVECTIRRDVDIDFIRQAERLDFLSLLTDTNVRDVVAGIVGQTHGEPSSKD